MKKSIILAGLMAVCCLQQMHAGWENDNKVDVNKPQSGRRCAFMGNSITEFWYHDWHGDLHPEFFTENGYLCRGISGQRTDQFLNRFDADIVAMHPLVTVIMGGVNDIGENGGVTYVEDNTFNNIVAMVDKAVAANIKPVICSVMPWGGASSSKKDKIVSLNNRLRNYCRQNKYPFVDYYAALVDGNRDMKAEYKGNNGTDGLHPNQKAYLVMESLVQPEIEALMWSADTVFEAENAVKVGSRITDYRDTRASGRTRVQYVGKGNVLKFFHNAPRNTTYYLQVFYATKDEGKSLTLTVDGTRSYTVDCPATGYNSFSDGGGMAFVSVRLSKGLHTITIDNEEDYCPYLDKFKVSVTEPAPTGINTVSAYITEDDSLYTLNGMKLSKKDGRLTRGIYIKNGKKVVIK